MKNLFKLIILFLCFPFLSYTQFDRALDFDGAGDQLHFGTPTALNLETFTIEFWIKTTDGASGLYVRFRSVSGTQKGFRIGTYGGTVQSTIQVAAGSSKTVKSTTVINDDTWHHIAVTRNNSNGEHKIYVDGVLEDTEVLAGTIMDLSQNAITLQQ